MVRNEKIQLSALVFLKRFLLIVLFMGSVSQSWAQIGLPPVITPVVGQPVSQKVLRGRNVQFNVLAVGILLNYQWRFNGTNIPNATGSSYIRTNVQPSDAGKYSVVVRNAVGSVTSADATLTLDNTPLLLTSKLLDDGKLNLNISGPLIATYVVQSSTNLKTWTSISTNLVVAGLLDLNLGKPVATNSATRFYRVRVF